MSHENLESANDINAMKEKLDMVEGQNAELKEQNTEMKEQIAKLMEEIEAMKLEKLQIKQNDPAQAMGLNPSFSQQMKRKLEEKSTDSADEKMDAKRVKMTGRSVPNWLIEVLAWIKRVEMADSKLSTSSWTFKQLCWPKLHSNVKPHKVDLLIFLDELNEESGIYQAKLKKFKYRRNNHGYMPIEGNIPIACTQPPKYITGFDRIHIFFLDGRILKFMECIDSKLNGISLHFKHIEISNHQSIEKIAHIHRFFEKMAKKTFSYYSEKFFDFCHFNKNAFALIENAYSLEEIRLHHDEDIVDVDLLIQWLIKSRPDEEKPKFLQFWEDDFTGEMDKSILIDRIKEQFMGSTQSANFLISFKKEPDYPIFSMENEQTGEVLALYQNQNQNQQPVGNRNRTRQFLVRHPNGQEHLRADWEEQMQQLNKLPAVAIQIIGTGEF